MQFDEYEDEDVCRSLLAKSETSPGCWRIEMLQGSFREWADGAWTNSSSYGYLYMVDIQDDTREMSSI